MMLSLRYFALLNEGAPLRRFYYQQKYDDFCAAEMTAAY